MKKFKAKQKYENGNSKPKRNKSFHKFPKVKLDDKVKYYIRNNILFRKSKSGWETFDKLYRVNNILCRIELVLDWGYYYFWSDKEKDLVRQNPLCSSNLKHLNGDSRIEAIRILKEEMYKEMLGE